MEFEAAKKICLTLMETADALYFSTIDQSGFPDTRAILNLRNAKQYPTLVQFFSQHQEDLLVYLSTNTSSEKFRQIAANPAASAYFCKPKKFQGVMLSGSAEVVSDVDIKHALWEDGWTMYYPGGVEDPDYAILRLTPRIIKGWYKRNRFKIELSNT